MSPYVVDFAYILTLCAFVTRDALLLRSLLVCSQLIIITYTLSIGVHLIAGWNSVFACINFIWVVLLLRERRAVELPPELKSIHAQYFAALTPSEFLKWWKQGRRLRLRDTVMARTGEVPASLYFLLDGTVRVTRGGTHVADLPAGSFIAEMSLLTGELPTADASTVDEVDVIEWPTSAMRQLADRNPKFWSKIQSVLGRDIVEKIKRTAAGRAVEPVVVG